MLKQKLRLEGELFELSEGWIVVHFEDANPAGTEYRQQDTILEIRDTPTPTTWHPERYILLVLKIILVPYTSKKGYLCEYRESSGIWWRNDDLVCEPKLILREFRTSSNEYIAYSENLKLLDDTDPNNHAWFKKFNNAWVN